MKSCLMFAFFYPLHSPDISTCSRGIQPILQKYEDAIESAKSAANALKRRLNLGFGRRFLCPVILGTVSLEIIHEAKRKKLGIPTRAIRGPMSIGLMTIGSNGGKPRLTKTVNTVVECVDPLTQIRTMHVLYTWQGRESTME